LEIKDKVKTIIADTFNLKYDHINDDTGPENVQCWDSFGQMNLVVVLEQEFSIVLEYEEIFRIIDTATLIDLIKEKLNEN
jgi:acyl carrier protein